MKKEQKITLSLFIFYLAVLTWIILFKLQFGISSLDHIRNINLIPFGDSVVANGKIDLDEIINNLIVFIPAGVYLGLLKPDWPFFKKILPLFGISLTYEILQFIFALGATDITDLMMNTLGGVIGIGIFMLLAKLLKEKTVKVLNIAAAICTVLASGFLVLLLAI